MNRLLFVTAVGMLVVGCNKPNGTATDGKPVAKAEAPTESPKSKPEDTKPLDKPAKKDAPPADEAKTVQQAKEELQSRIDRCLGGQPVNDVLGGTIGIWAVGKKIQSMDLVRVVQKYSKDGKPVPNQFVAAIKCTVAHNITGERETREFAIEDFTFRDGAWQTPFLR